MKELAITTEQFIIEEDTHWEGDPRIVCLRLRAQSNHGSLNGQMIVVSDDPHDVRINVIATDWSPRTYDTYVESARRIFAPLLATYNSRFGTRLRLRIPSEQDLEPKLSAGAKKWFERFVNGANRAGLHPVDSDRFCDFICVCHRFHIGLTEEDVFRLLVSRGFSEGYAREIATSYEEGRRLLKRNSEFPPLPPF